jgi:flagellar assembly protein FliH
LTKVQEAEREMNRRDAEGTEKKRRAYETSYSPRSLCDLRASAVSIFYSMSRLSGIIKSKDDSCSIKYMEYVPFDEKQSSPIDDDGGRPGTSSTAQNSAETGSGSVTTEAQQQMDKLVSEARNRAENIVQKAQSDAAAIKEEAFRSGYEAGQEAAIAEVQEAVDSTSRAFKAALEDIASLKDSILSRAESDIVQLTIAIAEKLVCRELKQHPDAIVTIVKEAIRAVRNADEIAVKVHPDDYVTLRQYAGDLMGDFSEQVGSPFHEEGNIPTHSNACIRIEEDTALTPGGCMVVTDTSLIDMSFETRIESIIRAIGES